MFQFYERPQKAITMKFLVVLLSVIALKCLVNGQTLIATLPNLVIYNTISNPTKSNLGLLNFKMVGIFLYQVGEISSIEVPAFADVHESSDSSLPYADRFTLYLSTFKPFQLKVFKINYLIFSIGISIDNIFLNVSAGSRLLFALSRKIFVRYNQLAP